MTFALAVCRRAAQTTSFPADTTCIQTLGFAEPGDHGGAVYVAATVAPVDAAGFACADGRYWEITGREVDVRQFGAVGDGVSDDSAAIQAALDYHMAGTVGFSPGNYRARGLRLSRPCRLVGNGAELVWTGGDEKSDLLQVMSSDVEIRQLTLRGDCYADFDTPVAPHALLRIDESTREGGELERISIIDMNFIGGRVGCFVGMVADIFIDRVRFERCRDYALILAVGPRRAIVRGLIARDIGLYGGVKTSYNGSLRATEKFILSDFIVERCGRLDPDPANWQEGLDLVAAYARQFVVSNGVISDCGNGAIELKTGAAVTELDEAYEDILITGVVMNVTGDRHAVVMNWTGRKTNTEKRGQRILLTNCTIRFNGANLANTEAAGVVIAAWSDVRLINNVIEGCGAGVVLRGFGAADDTVRAVVIAGNTIRGVGRGVHTTRGRVEDVTIEHNSIHAELAGISFQSAVVEGARIRHNTITQYGPNTPENSGVLLMDVSAVSIWQNAISARGHAIVALAGRKSAGDGEVAGNQVRSDRDAFRFESGRWAVYDNRLDLPARQRTIEKTRAARVSAAWNLRGLAEEEPYAAGSAGDIILSSASSLGQPLGWRLTPGDGSVGARWLPLNAKGEGVEALRPSLGVGVDIPSRTIRWAAKRLDAYLARRVPG